MSATDLAALSARRPLNETDRRQLTALQTDSTLPTMFSKLVEWMLEHGEKGEQEGYL